MFASWGSLGHVTAAEPGALIGFLGPRVFQALYDQPFPADVQTAENLAARGIIDAVLPPEQLRVLAERVLRVCAARDVPARPEPEPEPEPVASREPAWASVVATRDPRRPGVRELLRFGASDVVRLNGTGEGEADPGLVLAFCRFGDRGCVLLGHDRRNAGAMAAGLREARRGMRLAAELRLPLVTVIDTAGAVLSRAAEEGGLAGEIARCLVDLVTLSAPTLAVLLGQGTGGGALALAPADRVVAAEHAWLSPLPPEGASAIVYRDTVHAPELAQRQRVRSTELRADGIVDRLVAERPDAASEPVAFSRRLGVVVAAELARLEAEPAEARQSARHARYRHLGTGRGHAGGRDG